jgi:2-polyprenyl-6-methoxyphenol hydroxylase-like FAD-dependent oxidoreductase
VAPLPFPRDRPDATQRRGSDLIQLALDLTTNWHPSLRRLVSQSDPDSAFPVNVLTSVPLEPWPTTNVTLLGDALHTMTPGHGVGANTALRDAALLCRALTEVHTGQRQLHDAVSDYEQQVIPYGFERVRDSLNQNATRGDDPLYRPATRVLVLWGSGLMSIEAAFGVGFWAAFLLHLVAAEAWLRRNPAP